MKNAVGIIGLGLIGGSMAKAVREYIGRTPEGYAERIFGTDLNKSYVKRALDEGIIDGELTDDKFADCKLVMVAIPPRAAARWIKENAKKLTGSVLVDLCGVKRYICDIARPLAIEHEFTFVGGHPMAGKEVGGYENSSTSLFKGAAMILTPESEIDGELIMELGGFYKAIGFGRVTVCSAERHDEVIAYTSQLAHIASSAYIKSPTAQNHRGFSAGSYKDLTRVARLDENMWTELFMANREPLINELELLIKNLCDYRDVLAEGNEDTLREMLKKGRELKESAGGK